MADSDVVEHFGDVIAAWISEVDGGQWQRDVHWMSVLLAVDGCHCVAASWCDRSRPDVKRVVVQLKCTHRHSALLFTALTSWQERGQFYLPLNFSLSENFLAEILFSIGLFGAENHIFEVFRGKIEILSTQITPVGNLQLSVEKFLLPPQLFLTHDEVDFFEYRMQIKCRPNYMHACLRQGSLL